MSSFLSLISFVTFIAFIVYWWKKRKARLGAGENYQDDSNYQSVSKTKRIIGIVCVVSTLLSMATSPSVAEQLAEKHRKAVANLSPEEKSLYDAKYQKYILNFDETEAGDKALHLPIFLHIPTLPCGCRSI